MSAIQDLLKKKQQQTQKPVPVQPRGSAISNLLANKAPVDKQHQADRAKAEAQNKQLDSYKPSLMDKAKSVLSIFKPSNIRQTAKDTTKGSFTQTAAAIGSGLLDIGPRIANSIGIGNAIKSLPGVGTIAKTADTLRPGTVPNLKLPLPGKTAMEYSGNTSDLSQALSEATTQVGGFELGGAALKPFGLSKFTTGLAGNVLGGQAVTEAQTPKDRAKQAVLDGLFGVATEGVGLAFSKLRGAKIEPALTPTQIAKNITKEHLDPRLTLEGKPKPGFSTLTPADVPATTRYEDLNPLGQAKARSMGYESESAPIQRTVDSKPQEALVKVSKPSKVAQSIEAKAVENKLSEGFEGNLAGYDPITIKDQAERATNLFKDTDQAMRIIKGEEKLPEGLRGAAVIKAAEDHIERTGDGRMAYELANSPLVSETSGAAQELRLLAERSPDSVTAKLQALKKVREEAVAKKYGSTKKATEYVKNQIKKEVTKSLPKAKDWASFMDQLKCS